MSTSERTWNVYFVKNKKIEIGHPRPIQVTIGEAEQICRSRKAQQKLGVDSIMGIPVDFTDRDIDVPFETYSFHDSDFDPVY